MRKLFYLITVILLISCKKDNIEVDFNYNKFLSMKKKWEQLKIRDYSYTYSSLDFGCFSNKYVIKNNLVIALQPDTIICGHGVDSTIKYTIDDIFDKIEFRYKNPVIERYSSNNYWYCYKIEAEYDSVYFFPKRYEFKQKGKNLDITDTESNQTITDFKIN